MKSTYWWRDTEETELPHPLLPAEPPPYKRDETPLARPLFECVVFLPRNPANPLRGCSVLETKGDQALVRGPVGRAQLWLPLIDCYRVVR